MISIKDIFESLKEIITRAVPDLFVTAEPVADSAESYAHIQFRPIRKDLGFGQIEKNLRVDIQVVLSPALAEVPRADLYNISDKFDAAFCGYVPVADRFITLYETDSRIFDGILTYSFILSFSDFIDKFDKFEAENFDLMQELNLKEK